MLVQTVKAASALALVAMLCFFALQDHWFEQGGGALRAMIAPRSASPAAPAAEAAPVAGPAPRRAPHSGMGLVEISPDSNAQFQTELEINGARIHVLVDTGASHVMLTAADARALNIDPAPASYTINAQTANGAALFAPVRLRQLRVGDITVYDVDALVARPGQTGMSLLGMSFLRKLASFQVADGLFVMKQ